MEVVTFSRKHLSSISVLSPHTVEHGAGGATIKQQASLTREATDAKGSAHHILWSVNVDGEGNSNFISANGIYDCHHQNVFAYHTAKGIHGGTSKSVGKQELKDKSMSMQTFFELRFFQNTNVPLLI